VRQQAREVGVELGDAGVAAHAILVDGLREDPLELGRETRAHGSCGRDRILDDRAQGLRECLALERVRALAADELVEHEAQRVHVALRVDLTGTTLGLLGAHVLQRADQLARARHARPFAIGVVERARDAEIDHLGNTRGVDEHVAGLQVAVDDTLGVPVSDRSAHVTEQRNRLGRRKLARAHERGDGQRILDQLHRQVRRRPVDAGREDLRDRRVVHPREQLGFLREAPRGRSVRERRQDLERDLPVGMALLGFVHATHAARADAAHETEAADHRARRERDRGHECRDVRRRQVVAGGIVVLEQRVDLAPQLDVVRATLVEEARALLTRKNRSGFEKRGYVIPRALHGRPPRRVPGVWAVGDTSLPQGER